MSQTVRVRWPGKTAEHLFFFDFLFLFYQEKRKARKNNFSMIKGLLLLFFVEKKVTKKATRKRYTARFRERPD